ncbi:Sushi, nidogen and EGF-like domain-containing protein 1,Alpha-tectorin [Mytilus coruscus]|uniref:Sushi, nidogen and EGF-like domain-containing protein 1,Alpha-tectorin n=1 Tax=Mytilus coruscus TaxID=42192 RepID=A0A6J8EM10_MYTCO|nr:Sushi, nidogen and EGF-like domain-containing protein 1,Alpha-tectorin [Mytilus coruscus]
MTAYTPSPFPLASKRRLIAPYWADTDTRNGGIVWYRESTNLTLLKKASDEIQANFAEHFNFRAAWMFIATWDNVAFYGADEIGKQKRCTFQCVLVTNGKHSFTIFLYNKIEWTTGTASFGNSSTRLGGTAAQVGFDAGDGFNFYAIEASRTASVINVTRMSNIDNPGKFIFRVDTTKITNGGCNVEGTLTITPREATMFGGTQLIISGPCFNLTKAMTLVMADGETVPCQKYNDFSVSCISPQIYRTGKEIVSLYLTQGSNQTMTFHGVLTIVNHALTRHVLSRGQLSWKHGTTVNIIWKQSEIKFPVDANISLDLYYLQNNHTKIKLRRHSSISLMDTEDLASEMYNFKLNFSKEAGIVKLSTNKMNSPYYWSDMFTVNVGFEQSQAVCNEMLDEDIQLPAINTDDVQPCPCTLDVASLDTIRFSIDPLCHKQEGSRYECSNQPFAQVCFKQNVASSQGYDHQCCYDEVGVLMNPDGYYGSGYVNRYHYHGDGDANIPFLSNFVYDIMPYQHCCIHTSEDMGEAYTFNPVGEFSALSNGNLSLQLRMEQLGTSHASSVTSFVVQPYPEAEIIEVQVNQIRGIDVLVNGTLVDFDLAISKVISVEGATIEKISENPSTVVLNFYTEGLSIQSSSNLNVLNLLILTSPDRQNGNLTGLFGDNDGVKDNDLVSNNNDLINANASASDIHHTFGLSWRIQESESLFTYEGGKTYASYQNEHFNPMFEIPENVPTRITDTCGSNFECIYDYLVTNNEQFGQMSANSSVSFDVILGLTAPVVTCGFPPNTSNAAWDANGYTEGSIAFLNCTKGYYPVDVNLECLSSGNWSSVNISCIPYCGGPSPVANGLWVPNEGTNGRRATLRCKDGFYGEEIEIFCIDNGTWTEFTGLCLSAQTLPSTSDSNSKMSTASVTMTLSNLEDTTKTKTSDEIVQSSSKVYTSIKTTRQSSTVTPTIQRSSRQTMSSIQSSTTPSAQTTSPGTSTQTTPSAQTTNPGMSTQTTPSAQTISPGTSTQTTPSAQTTSPGTSTQTTPSAQTTSPGTNTQTTPSAQTTNPGTNTQTTPSAHTTSPGTNTQTTPSAQTTSPGTSTQTTAATTSTIHNQQEISQTSESSPLQTTSNMPQSQYVSVKSTSSIDIKSTQDSIFDNGQTSEAIAGSTTRKLSSTLKSSYTNESTDTDNFTIAISVTISVVCLVIVVTVVAVAMAKISKERKDGSNRYEIRKSYEEDRSSTKSDPSSWYNFQIKRPLFGQEWPHQQPNHLH